MQNIIDISGQRYGRLTVIGYSHTDRNRKTFWKCQCDCGTIKVLRKDNFVYSYSEVVSCGCKHKENISKKKKDKINGKFLN